MKLHWSPRSPFVRKVMIVLHETGLLDRVDCVRSPVAMAGVANPEVLRDNPLGKIPTLVLDDGTALFDSRVICEYLDMLAGERPERLVPAGGMERIECLRWQAFGDGLTDILLLWRIEMARGEARKQVISQAFDDKVRASLARLEREVPALEARPFGLGHIAILCAAGQLDFRFASSNWRAAHPRLSAFADALDARPSAAATKARDDGALAMGDIEMPLVFEAA
ncbi:glutathione S-transferase family protein [Mangrovibrevibacter kandeliae]|uniref:glutathione S-transferase family protein n=1 Tax=Mangrovibrevibacter kandeliae TaxID=2968473 RepID=UPI002117B6C3|nr:glutathione S-transferase N-terminal domain-containing protein [Aurantimonas sp. CSK15Z-1]MCQ8781896.1 glutathione S-transferase N-terminal domain-containing protein [Aurantimonas sp. CSK15Z-1]